MAATPSSSSGSTTSGTSDSITTALLRHTTTFLLPGVDSASGATGTLREVSNDIIDPYRQRRPHHKSRTGCLNCRKRRVKCDEKEPSCSNCSRRREPCKRQRGSGFPSIASTDNGTMPPPLSQNKTPLRGQDTMINLLHMELFHHFQACTQHTLVGGPKLWEPVMKLSFRFEFLAHAVLCVSARHLAFLSPQEPKYAVAAATHLSQTLHAFRNELSFNFSAVNVDAFMATASLIQVDICTNTDFVSFGDKGAISFDPSLDRIFELSLGLQHIFITCLPHVFGRSSVFAETIRHSPRSVLVKAAKISKCTINLFARHFAVDRPMTRQLLQVPQPFIRDKDLEPEESWMYHKYRPVEVDEPPEESYARAIRRLCLLMSSLPEAQSGETTQGLPNDLVADYARYCFTFPVLLERPLVQMIKRKRPKALLLLYHYYRCARILLPQKECWWLQKRANILEIVLRDVLVKECLEFLQD